MDALSVAEQGALVEEYLAGLAEAFGCPDAQTEQVTLDDDAVEVRLTGSDLGLLIGPKGATLTAVHELARASVQHRAHGNREGRFRIDIAGYRQKRRAALEKFTLEVIEQVKSSGQPKRLEPMNAVDRKVIHDTATDVDGVRTVSEGEDPRRRVVILPDGPAEATIDEGDEGDEGDD